MRTFLSPRGKGRRGSLESGSRRGWLRCPARARQYIGCDPGTTFAASPSRAQHKGLSAVGCGRKQTSVFIRGRRCPGMRVRHIIEELKTLRTDSSWSTTDLRPKHAPIYSRTKPIRAGWKWRSGRAESEKAKYILIAECNPYRGNWKAALLLEDAAGASVVARYEYHSSHPGLHVHADCTRSGVETGASGLDNLRRFPRAGHPHRRAQAWTEATFWEAAKRFFRIEAPKGPLI